MQVQVLNRYVARSSAVAALRQDDRFQENMRDPQIRGGVDAVIEKPERMPRLRSKEAMACLAQLRQLRVVNRQHGGGTIDLDELQQPWTQEDDDQVQGMCIRLPGCTPRIIC